MSEQYLRKYLNVVPNLLLKYQELLQDSNSDTARLVFFFGFIGFMTIYGGIKWEDASVLGGGVIISSFTVLTFGLWLKGKFKRKHV